MPPKYLSLVPFFFLFSPLTVTMPWAFVKCWFSPTLKSLETDRNYPCLGNGGVQMALSTIYIQYILYCKFVLFDLTH